MFFVIVHYQVKEPVFPSPLRDKELEGLFRGSIEGLSIITKDANDSCIAKFHDDWDINANLSSYSTTPTSAVVMHYRKINNSVSVALYLDLVNVADVMWV